MNVRSPSTRPLSAVLLLVALTGCKTWEPVTMSPERLIAEQRPTSVRVSDSNGVEMTLRNPMIVNDSIVAVAAPVPGAPFQQARVGTLSSEINSLEVARFSPGKTILLIGAITTVSFGWARAASSSAGGRPETIPPDPKGLALALLGGIRFAVAVGR